MSDEKSQSESDKAVDEAKKELAEALAALDASRESLSPDDNNLIDKTPEDERDPVGSDAGPGKSYSDSPHEHDSSDGSPPPYLADKKSFTVAKTLLFLAGLFLLVLVMFYVRSCYVAEKAAIEEEPYVEYHENGKKKLELHYKNGKLEALETEWYENGQKNWEIHYKNGKKEGLETWWYENGQKYWERHYKYGLPDGRWTEWFPNGQKWSEAHYKNGDFDGPETGWYANGQKRLEYHYKNSELVSASVWKPDGEPCPITRIVDGSGILAHWHENGQKSSETHYKNSEQDGLETNWYPNGQKESEIYYSYGVEVSRKEF